MKDLIFDVEWAVCMHHEIQILPFVPHYPGGNSKVRGGETPILKGQEL